MAVTNQLRGLLIQLESPVLKPGLDEHVQEFAGLCLGGHVQFQFGPGLLAAGFVRVADFLERVHALPERVHRVQHTRRHP